MATARALVPETVVVRLFQFLTARAVASAGELTAPERA